MYTKKVLSITYLVIFINCFVGFPFISSAYRDEALYIINAAKLAGFESSFNNNYGIGFSLLLAPFLTLGEHVNPHTVAVLLNSFFLLVIVVMLRIIHRNNLFRPGELEDEKIWAIAIVSVYPALILYSKHAIPEILLSFGVIAQYFLLDAFQRKASSKYLLAFALLSAIIFASHPRMLGVAVSAFVVLTCLLLNNNYKKNRMVAALALFSIFLISIGLYWLKLEINAIQLTNSGIPLPDGNESLAMSIAQKFINQPINVIKDTISAMAGQLLYLWIGTAGFFLIGLFTVIRDFKFACIQETELRRGIDYRSLNLLISFFLVLAISSIQKSGAHLPDQFIFGRYMDCFSPILIFLALSRNQFSFSGKWLITSTIIGLALLVLVYLRAEEITASYLQRHRFWTIPSLNYWFNLFSGISISYFFLAGASLQFVLYGCSRKLSAKEIYIGIFIFFLLQSTMVLFNSFNEYVKPRAAWRNDVQNMVLKHGLQHEKCVSFDIGGGIHWAVWDYGVTNFTQKVSFCSTPDLSCSCHFVISKQSNLTNGRQDKIQFVDTIIETPSLYIYKMVF